MATRYVTTAQAAELMNVPERTLRYQIQQGKIRVEKAPGAGGGGGVKNLIDITSLPREAQLRYAALQDGSNNGHVDLAGYRSKFGEEGEAELMNRLDAVREMLAFSRLGQGSLMEKRAEVAGRLGVSVGTLYRWEQNYKKEALGGLMDAVERADKGQPRQLCRMAQDFVHSEICVSTKPTNRAVYGRLLQVSERLGPDACAVCPYNKNSLYRAELSLAGRIGPNDESCDRPQEGMVVPASYTTVDRYIKSIPQSVKALGRNGVKYWEAQHMPKALRAKPEKINEVWFGDHHEFDLFVKMPDGRVMRPWLTAWMDACSGVISGWALSVQPNGDTIAESLTRGIGRTVGSPFWGAPLMLYIDNGKDYRSHRMEGDGLRDYSIGQLNIDFGAENALLKTLGIGVTHAIPYRAWSKTIERMFGTIERRFIKGILPGWCGHKPEERPESLSQEIRDGKILSYDEFCAYFVNKVLPGYHGLASEDGRSPMDIYLNSAKARGEETVSWAVLSMVRENREQRRVGTIGIKFGGKIYNDPALSDYIGEYVTVLYSSRQTESIGVMAGHKYICEAWEAERLQLVGEDPEKLAEHMSRQQTAKRKTREALRLPVERIRKLHDLVMEQPDIDTAATITTVVHERAWRDQQAAKAQGARERGERSAEELATARKIKAELTRSGNEMIDMLRAAEG